MLDCGDIQLSNRTNEAVAGRRINERVNYVGSLDMIAAAEPDRLYLQRPQFFIGWGKRNLALCRRKINPPCSIKTKRWFGLVVASGAIMPATDIGRIGEVIRHARKRGCAFQDGFAAHHRSPPNDGTTS
jgi:hypothetical protein